MSDAHVRIAVPRFDHEWAVQDLLSAADRCAVRSALEAWAGSPVCMTDAAGEVVFGEMMPGAARAAVRGELEPVAYLHAAAPQASLNAAACLLELLLRAQLRYRMASTLHVDAIEEDYRILQESHARLQASEERYRILAADLERRVDEQVATIEATQRKLYQAEKLASVGQLAAGVAHEINNPIGFVKSNLKVAAYYQEKWTSFAQEIRLDRDHECLREKWRELQLDEAVDDLGALVRESLDGVGRVARIVADLKSYSRIDAASRERLDINDVVHSVCSIVSAQVRDSARITLELGTLPPVNCEAAALGQLFTNLLINAAQAMNDPGEITIATHAEDEAVVVLITDNGRGIPADVLPRIFDPFFTTKDVGAGVGLGLTVCADIVRGHGGTIEIQSAPGQGTQVKVSLPRDA